MGPVVDETREVELGAALLAWLPPRLAPAGTDFSISDLSSPPAGYSGKTAFFTASWVEGATSVSRDLVLRLQSADHQLFTTPDALRQAEVTRRLGAHPGVSTPRIVLTESDPTVLGSPFYLMERVEGRVPSDVPSWHKRGWAVDLSAAERSAMYDHALRALVAVHAVRDPEDLAFLRGDGASDRTPLQRYLDDLVAWHAWCAPDLVVGAELLDEALRTLLEAAPATDAEGVVWGDARVGNISFAPDLSVAALFDFETATTGPPDIDLGWWLMFERYLCEAIGFTRQPGVPEDDEIVRRYLALGGRLTGEIGYYKLLAAVVLSLITNRLSVLLVRDGLDEAVARTYPQTAVALVEQFLTELRSGF